MTKRLATVTLPDGKEIPGVIEFFNGDEASFQNDGNITDGEVIAKISWVEEEQAS